VVFILHFLTRIRTRRRRPFRYCWHPSSRLTKAILAIAAILDAILGAIFTLIVANLPHACPNDGILGTILTLLAIILVVLITLLDESTARVDDMCRNLGHEGDKLGALRFDFGYGLAETEEEIDVVRETVQRVVREPAQRALIAYRAGAQVGPQPP
jgi:hypothetical protein